MNTDIQQILSNDDQLFNRVYAYGPGDGLNRIMAVVEDSASIAAYGLRETVLELQEIADRADLIEQANEYLASVAAPAQDIRLTYHFYAGESAENLTYGGEIVTYNGEPIQVGDFADAVPLRRGDTIRVVSEDLGVAFTGVIAELDWSVGSVDIMIGTPPYNLLDVINGPEEDEDRKKVALGLPVPIGFRASRASPGVDLRVNPYNNSRAVGIEIYASTVSPVASTRDKLIAKGPGTRFMFPELEPGALYYFKARSYDNEGNYSGFTSEISEISGYIDGGDIGEGTIDITPFASELRPPRNVVNLPTVSNFSSGYLEGDYVVFEGELYKLVSATGDPNTDWSLVDYETLEGDTIARQIVAGQITAGAIGADQIAANAITAEKIAAGSITLDKFGSTSENKQTNPGFETGNLTGWTQVGTGGTWAATSTDANSGVYSARAAADGSANTQVLKSQQITVFAGEEIDVSFYHRSGTANSATVLSYVYWFDNADNIIGSFSPGPFAQVSTSWTRYSTTIGTAPAGAAYAHVYIGVGSEAVGQLFYVDDVSFAVAIDSSLAAGTSRIDGSGFETRDGAGALKTKMGAITGLGGVPSGVDYGFWGSLGAGVYIQGALKIIASGTFGNFQSSTTSIASDAAGTTQTVSKTVTLYAGGVTVPTGKKWIILVSSANNRVITGDLVLQGFNSYGSAVSGVNAFDVVVSAGTYDNLFLEVESEFYRMSTTGGSVQVGGNYIILEVDA